MAALAGLTVLVVLDEGEAELLRRRVHEYQRAHPGSAPAVADRLSVNGAPALPGLGTNSLTSAADAGQRSNAWHRRSRGGTASLSPMGRRQSDDGVRVMVTVQVPPQTSAAGW
jgi:hypothetical protein